MAKFIVRRTLLLVLTMILVSMAVFLITEASPGNVARNVLGAFVTPEQEASFLAQMGLDKPVWLRYIYWLIGSDWQAGNKIGLPLKRIITEKDFVEWWAVRRDDRLIRWKLAGDDLIAMVRHPDGSVTREKDNDRWVTDEKGVSTSGDLTMKTTRSCGKKEPTAKFGPSLWDPAGRRAPVDRSSIFR